MRNITKKMKFTSSRKVYSSYGKVTKITTVHLGILLDNLIPMTFYMITLFFKKKYNKELFRITINNKEN